MSNAIVSLILVALMITSGLSFSRVAISSVEDFSQSWKAEQKASINEIRTNFSLMRADYVPGVVNIYLVNTGQVQLDHYQSWDVIAQYYDQNGVYYIKSLNYMPGTIADQNKWTVNKIYASPALTQGAIFQPGIIDPGEVAELQLKLSPAPGPGRLGWIIISTEKGLTGSIQFQG